MQILFVHGMGRTFLSGWPLFFKLRRSGFTSSTLGYIVFFEDFASIQARLVAKISAMADRGEYVLVGHSLGGVLIRAAVNDLPPDTRKPKHVFLLGSPISSPRLAEKFWRNPLYRLFTRDCGLLLASTQRMAEIGSIPSPTTGIAGVSGLSSKHSPFQGELNDGLVSLSEIRAAWLTDVVLIPTIHTLLPYDQRVAEIILARAAGSGE